MYEVHFYQHTVEFAHLTTDSADIAAAFAVALRDQSHGLAQFVVRGAPCVRVDYSDAALEGEEDEGPEALRAAILKALTGRQVTA